MRALSMVIGTRVSANEPHTVEDVAIEFTASSVGVLVELEAITPSYLYFRLIDADGRQLSRSENTLLLGRMEYTQVSWTAILAQAGDCAIELRRESGQLLKRRYVRKVGP